MNRQECLEQIADCFQSLLQRYITAKQELNQMHGFPEDVTAFVHVQEASFLAHKWRELRSTPNQYQELYKLIELYLATDPNNPIIRDHYDNLCHWFKTTTRPDGSKPLPISETVGVPLPENL